MHPPTKQAQQLLEHQQVLVGATKSKKRRSLEGDARTA
jgi:hypothetical protein